MTFLRQKMLLQAGIFILFICEGCCWRPPLQLECNAYMREDKSDLRCNTKKRVIFRTAVSMDAALEIESKTLVTDLRVGELETTNKWFCTQLQGDESERLGILARRLLKSAERACPKTFSCTSDDEVSIRMQHAGRNLRVCSHNSPAAISVWRELDEACSQIFATNSHTQMRLDVDHWEGDNVPARPVAIEELSAGRADLHQKRVQVAGFWRDSWEGGMFYPYEPKDEEEEYLLIMQKKCMTISRGSITSFSLPGMISMKDLVDSQWVTVEGVFVTNRTTMLDWPLPAVVRITRIAMNPKGISDIWQAPTNLQNATAHLLTVAPPMPIFACAVATNLLFPWQAECLSLSNSLSPTLRTVEVFDSQQQCDFHEEFTNSAFLWPIREHRFPWTDKTGTNSGTLRTQTEIQEYGCYEEYDIQRGRVLSVKGQSRDGSVYWSRNSLAGESNCYTTVQMSPNKQTMLFLRQAIRNERGRMILAETWYPQFNLYVRNNGQDVSIRLPISLPPGVDHTKGNNL